MQGSLIVLIVVISVSYIFLTNDNNINVTLDKCVDGDTAWFIVEGKREKVRFLGINAPESTNIQEEYGKLASDYTCNRLKEADEIYLEIDSNSDRYDKYGRLLAYVFVDDNNLNELLLEQGLAEVKYIYDEYEYIDYLCDSQYKAYKKKLNIWNIYDYTENYCYDINGN